MAEKLNVYEIFALNSGSFRNPFVTRGIPRDLKFEPNGPRYRNLKFLLDARDFSKPKEVPSEDVRRSLIDRLIGSSLMAYLPCSSTRDVKPTLCEPEKVNLPVIINRIPTDLCPSFAELIRASSDTNSEIYVCGDLFQHPRGTRTFFGYSVMSPSTEAQVSLPNRQVEAQGLITTLEHLTDTVYF